MVKRKGGGFKKAKVHLSEFLGDAPITAAPIVPREECSTDLSIPGMTVVTTLATLTPLLTPLTLYSARGAAVLG